MKLKKLLKPYFLIPLIILVILALIFIVWQFLPSCNLYIAVLDKPVPATQADGHSYLGDVDNDYRKHIGLYWLLNNQKINNPQTGKPYDYKTDYFGNILDDEHNVEYERPLSQMTIMPDLLYLSDAYGIESDEDKYTRGITREDMNMIAVAQASGAVIIGEQDILHNGTDEEVSEELQSLFGAHQTGWVGRYIYDLQDFTDVPYWAPPMYEEKYGQKWLFTGPGILLVGNGDIIVLEEKECFNSKNLLKISVNDEYKKEFGNRSLNYYNWFEIIQPDYGTESIATYTLDLNAVGMEKFSKISNVNTFTAMTRKITQLGNISYYFAGDFNDYVSEMQLSNFCFADTFYRLISFDRDGDVKNFYWNFYEPVMKKILADVKKNPIVRDDDKSVHEDVAKIDNNQFQICTDGSWTSLDIKGFNMNGILPGSDSYSRNYEMYMSLLKIALDTGANTIRAYDLLPPEFYRALYDINNSLENDSLYLIQTITSPEDMTATVSDIPVMESYAHDIVRAIFGDATISDMVYAHDVGSYLIGFVLDPEIDIINFLNTHNDYTFNGVYFASDNPVQSYYAAICESVFTFTRDTYGCKIPIGAKGDVAFLPGAGWNLTGVSYNVGSISALGDAVGYYFAAYTLLQSDEIFLNNKSAFSYRDEAGDYPFGGYVQYTVSSANCPVLIDGISVSTAANMYEQDRDIHGNSELEQGEALVRMLKAIDNSGAVGGLISDLNDNWSGLSTTESSYVVPKQDNCLWFNAVDTEQTKGVVAIEPKMPTQTGLEINDNGRVSQIQLSRNEGYLYITVLLSSDIDFDTEQMFIGFDTYQRNDGEYYYNTKYFANSLSGMEFVIEFESKSSASLYVTPSYNRAAGRYISSESYTGAYDLVSVLNYGSFTEANTQFYYTGTTVHIRIPWAMLHITDPVQKLVINDTVTGTLTGDVKTTSTDGVLVSLLIASKIDSDTTYIFPESKKSPNYKVYKWANWETVSYDIRAKQSCAVLKKYFN